MLGNTGPEAAAYPPQDMFCAPGSTTVLGADAIRFKNAVVGATDVMIAINASLQSDIPQDTTLTPGFTPSYLTVSPDGRVSANFTGVVRAEGLSLQGTDFNLISTMPERRLIQWTNSADNRTAEDFIMSYDSGPSSQRLAALLLGTFGANTRNIRNEITIGRNTLLGDVIGCDIGVDSPGIDSRIIARRPLGGRAGEVWSSFLQWAFRTDTPYRVEFGTRSASIASGINQYNFNYNQSFQNIGMICIAKYMFGANYAGTSLVVSGPISNYGFYIVMNSAIAQDISLGYIAIGY